MKDTKVKFSLIVENQLPSFVIEEFPLVAEFISEYYRSLDSEGLSIDILENIDKYNQLKEVTNLIDHTQLTSTVLFNETTIGVESTYGFPNSYGLIKINDEIITYKNKTKITFNDCIRGFSGITSFRSNESPDQLVFSTSEISEHLISTKVENLSILFLKEFYLKIKKQLAPGFEEREFYSDLNEELFIKQSKDFYSSKGSEQSFKILFKSLYGEDVTLIRPQEYLIKSSNAEYRITKDLVVENIEGNILNLQNRTIYQDESNIFSKGIGIVDSVEEIVRNEKKYYKLKLFYDSTDPNSRNFSVHPKTLLINSVKSGADVLDVDSTVGFESSGTIIANNSTQINYTSKSLTQFYGCTGINLDLPPGTEFRHNSYAYGYVGVGTEDKVTFRVSAVLNSVGSFDFNLNGYQEDDRVEIKTLGYDSENYRDNNWFFNISVSYDIKSLLLLDSSNFTYQVSTYDAHNFLSGDKAQIILNDGTKKEATITSIIDTNSFSIKDQGQLNTNGIYTIQKILSKVNSKDYPELSNHNSNVQNIYTNLQSTFIASPSIPSYFKKSLDVNDRSITFSGTFSGDSLEISNHGLYTGDSVYYKSGGSGNTLNILEGNYFVKQIDLNNFKLSKSKSNIYSNKFIQVSGTVINNKFELFKFKGKKLKSQKLIRKISNPINIGNITETNPGATGILVNGVEILNYKSEDAIFYGPINDVTILSEGINYDVIVPPILSISDVQGIGATGFCEIEGILQEVNVLDAGFDYVTNPIVKLNGGNGKGAVLVANLKQISHEVSFNSNSTSQLVNLSNNTIGFSSYHKFKDSENIIYVTDNQTSVGGLSTNSSYYISVQDAYNVKVYKTESDARSKQNAIDLTSYGVGNHKFVSVQSKKVISSVNVLNSGVGYRNRKIEIPSTGINTASNIIYAKNHRYMNGDILVYNCSGNVVSGLSTSEKYYAVPVDVDNFKLALIGSGATAANFYLQTNQFVNLQSIGSGTHTFNHEPITLSISGVVGVSTFTGQNYQANLQPIVRGSLKSVFLSSIGVGYGSSEILNYEKQPSYKLKSGKGAELLPVISDGKIVNVIIKNSGDEYNSPPYLVVSGNGTGAILRPIVDAGAITDVNIISGGIKYDNYTSIAIIAAGETANIKFNIKPWNINLVERLIQTNKIEVDDSILTNGLNSNYELQFVHAYSPRNLRQSVYSTKFVNGKLNYIPDLNISENGQEVNSDSHSPIIGWAYDGNPIYGPYGYSSITGGSVRTLLSGYDLVKQTPSTRPSVDSYPLGFFVEDYEYKATGDLDVYNGRFCKTPEYPNGTYAYFTTIESVLSDSGPFKNFKKPKFPYFIGPKYKSEPIKFNFDKLSNQDDINIELTGLLRNTQPYNITKNNSSYEYILNPNKTKKRISKIKSISTGNLNDVGILTGGSSYRIGDNIIFEDNGTPGDNAYGKVDAIGGKTVNSISVASTTISNIEFYPSQFVSSFIGFSTQPHELLNSELVSLDNLNFYGKDLKGTYRVGVRSDFFTLSSGIGSTAITGITTYFNISGSLNYPNIRVNDILEIDSEKIKVLYIDKLSSRIKVIRQYEGTPGFAHTAGAILYENPKKFTINSGYSTSFDFDLNQQIYFDPKESLGLGMTSGVGIGTTISFSNPGAGITQIFIPTKSIYLPNHQFKTGTNLVYSSGGGNPISVSTDGVSIFQLTSNQIVYTAKISDDLIGISTSKIGVGTAGSFVGVGTTSTATVLYFTGIGTGITHSFSTNYDVIIKGELNKNTVTVSLASTHLLSVDDTISLVCTPGISTTISIQYNDSNRRLIANSKTFQTSDVNIDNNSIKIINHNLHTGQKIIHTSSSPVGGLFNQSIYYVIVIGNDYIKLANSVYEATLNFPVEIDLLSASNGTISPINPRIEVISGQPVVFDLSDSSLSYTKNSLKYSAFKLNFYTDPLFANIFESSEKNSIFEVSRSGSVGIDTNAKVSIISTNNLPQILYYKLDPINLDENDSIKKEIIIDSDAPNCIYSVSSEYSGPYNIIGIGSTSFNYNILNRPEKVSYTSSESSIEYTTNSLNEKGPIKNISLLYSGKNYKEIPSLLAIISGEGNGAIVTPSINQIGSPTKIEIEDIGYDYPSDISLRPTGNFPQIIKIDNLNSFSRIGISSVGTNYLTAPDLIVIDGYTKNVVTDVDIFYNLKDTEVTIAKNTSGLYDTIPTIIPINNSNGIGINSITFNSTNKTVTVGLAVSYSSSADFPFVVGDKILIENISVGVNSTSKGYNSQNYNYSLFTIISIDSNIGGANGSIVYDLTNYLKDSENPGTYDPNNSSGRIIPQKYFPIFDISLQKNNFYFKEIVKSKNSTGTVESWNLKSGYLKISSFDKFSKGNFIEGLTSKSKGIISEVETHNALFDTNSFSIVDNGWRTNSGFMNEDNQRMSDNDYYQYFSYSLKSKVSYDKWGDVVGSTNHPTGFKKFSDLIVETQDTNNLGINTSQDKGDFTGLADLIRVVDLNCVNDFDLATEKTLKIGSNIISDEIILKSKTLQDYFESIGNRVLMVDDISDKFNSNPRPTPYSIVDTFDINSARSKKYITYVKDRRFIGERQILLVSLLHNGSLGFLNQYGRIETVSDMGSFDFNIAGTDGQLLFYPTKYEVNAFNINSVSYNIRDSISGIGSTNLGNLVRIESSTKNLPVGLSTATTIVGISSTYRSSKVLIEFGAEDSSYYEFDEIVVVHDGTNVQLLDYGQLTTDSTSSIGSAGLGTYNAYLSGSDLNIDFTPNTGLGVTFNVNTLRVSIANTASSGVGTITLNTSILNSRQTSIASSTSPIVNTIAEYSNDYSCAYYIVSVEDTTNNQYQVSEIVVADDGTTASIVEFGIAETGATLGSFDAGISGSNTQLYFTPIANSNVEVRVFQNALRLVDTFNTLNEVDFTNASINTGYGVYEGTFTDVKRNFDLTHRQFPIFQRNFNGSDSNIVNLTKNTIKIPNHFYVTGEELLYTHSGAGTTQAIGIATTTISGIGLTDKLPPTLYAVKIDDLNIRVAASSTDALKTLPNILDLTVVGIGTSHTFTAKNQNSRVLLSIDNVIQSPIVSTSVTTTLAQQALITEDTVTFVGITSFFGGDLIKIDNEIMRIDSVGFGSTNVLLVERPWMGTGVATHSNGSLVTKVNGDYNIIDNTINFVTAPYGRIPIGTTSGNPNDVDYIGIDTHSTFSGRSFLRSGTPNTSDEPYFKNYIFDDISASFTGYSTAFNLKSNGFNITEISTSNAIVLINDVFQGPQRSGGSVNIVGDYTLKENVGITSIQFTGSISSTLYDVNTANIPSGGIIVSVGSTNGFGYQPLVAAGGTATISGLGTISSISIGNSGSGYRIGIQTVRVGVQTSSTGNAAIKFIGTATVSNGHVVSIAITNPGTGYTSTNAPIVVFDSPLSYSNIPLVYSSSSILGFGTQATVNVVVGQGSSVIDFEIQNLGYGYGQGEILTIGIGGTVGIPTTGSGFQEFQITVDRTFADKFVGWSVGDLQVLDPFDSLFDGTTVSFPITDNGIQKSIKARTGSNIDVQATLLIFINDILQVPGSGYLFTGGSYITFTEPPKAGDTSKILFYKGTGDVDVLDVDVLETIKVGDDVRLNDDVLQYQENERTVTKVNSTNSINTNPYAGPGITANENYERPLIWCRQTEDRVIGGKVVAKDRIIYEPLIYPTTRLIQSVGVGSTVAFVESVKTFFDSAKENTSSKIKNTIQIISQDIIVGASATAVVSSAGTISSIVISDGGSGYSSIPSVTISTPVGLGTTQSATGICSITSGIVTSITLSNAGTGYTSSNPPKVLIAFPTPTIEQISDVSYSGDFGIISGISTTSVGIASTGIIFDLFISNNSFLRDSSIVGTAVTISGIQTGYYFIVNNSNIGNGVTSLNSNGSVVGVGNSFLDNVYQVAAVSIAQTSAVGVGVTYVARVTVSVSNYNNLTGIGYSNFFGEYSWGKISIPSRKSPKSFNTYNNGLLGISTSPIIERVYPLRYLNYN